MWKNKVVCVNAGHGTSNGSAYYTYCHPDHTPKVTAGSTRAGSMQAAAVSYGTTFLDGISESQINLALALRVKAKLLSAGYDVLMLRENADVQMDNVARTVLANQYADCHVSIHYDSTDYGIF